MSLCKGPIMSGHSSSRCQIHYEITLPSLDYMKESMGAISLLYDTTLIHCEDQNIISHGASIRQSNFESCPILYL